MIFVTLGTQDKSFARLLEAIQKQIDLGNIKEEVIVQAGITKFKSKDMKVYSFLDESHFQNYMEECKILITHGGVGSILTGLRNKKIVIAAPRLKKYDEHESDHQKEIIEEFSKLGYLIPLFDFEDLGEVLKKAKTFKPKEYPFNNQDFIQKLTNYIDTGKL